MSSQVTLRLLPSARCLFDEPIRVTVSGLSSLQEVRLRARARDERGEEFNSWGVFRADQRGQVDLSRDAPLRGTYSGVHPMGLLWSMRPETPHKYFFKNKALIPHTVTFTVHDKEDRLLAEQTNERGLMGNGVQRQTVTGRSFSGVLFTPPGAGPFPAVLDLCTFMSEKRACLLSNRGFVVLTVPVYSDRPEKSKHLDLDRFEDAVQFLLRQPKVGSEDVGIVSRSKGGDVALSLAAFVKDVGAVVWINGCCSNVAVPLFYKKRQILSPLMYDFSDLIPTPSGAHIVKNGVMDPRAEENRDCVVPLEKATAQFLFVASEDDLNWDSKAFMEQMVERLKHHGKENFEAVCYPLAGHLLEPPYGPYCASAFHGLLNYEVAWGGQPEAHAEAEVHMWKKIQDFLRTHLKTEANEARAKL